MREGKIALPVLKRSILKNLTPVGRLACGTGVGNDYACTAIQEMSDGVFVGTLTASCVRILDVSAEEAYMGTVLDCLVAEAVGKLSTANVLGTVRIHTANVTMTLPHALEEEELKALTAFLNKSLRSYDIDPAAGYTTVSEAVKGVCVSLTLIGEVRLNREAVDHVKKEDFQKHYSTPAGYRLLDGAEVVVTGQIGIEGTLLLTRAYREALCRHYSPSFVRRACEMVQLDVRKAAELAGDCHVPYMHSLAEGGILGGLWEMAEHCGLGMEADLKAIPIGQETVEITEYLNVNPYQLRSGGAMVMLTEDAKHLLSVLHGEGIDATVIGHMTRGKARILHNKDEIRYLDLPAKDSIYDAKLQTVSERSTL